MCRKGTNGILCVMFLYACNRDLSFLNVYEEVVCFLWKGVSAFLIYEEAAEDKFGKKL